jgi:large subunit ribosomal protein L22
MASTNTEKPTSKAEKKKIQPVAPKKTKIESAPVKKEEKKIEEGIGEKTQTKETKEKKEEKKIKPKVKKEEARVYSKSLPVSTKVAVAICRFIKNKKVDDAIKKIEQVTLLKQAIPMKGEIPHRHGKIMSGRFPQRAAKEFLPILKSLKSNALEGEIEEPIICLAVANKASRPYAKKGRARKKRTHVLLVAKNKEKIKKENKK